MLIRKQSAKTLEKDWFEFAAPVSICLASDYLALRLLYRIEPYSTALSIAGKALDVAEKSLKLFLTVLEKPQEALSWAVDAGHGIEKLRSRAATHCAVFDEPAIRAFSVDLNDRHGKLYQYVRYGSEKTTHGCEMDLGAIIPVVDRVFVQALMNLPHPQRMMLLFVSPIKTLVTGSKMDQSLNRAISLDALRFNNREFHEFEELCKKIDVEYSELLLSSVVTQEST